MAGALPTVSAAVGEPLAAPAADGPVGGGPPQGAAEGHALVAAAASSDVPDTESVVAVSHLPDQTGLGTEPAASDTGGLMQAGVDGLGAPPASADFVPMSQPLKRLCLQALHQGQIKGGPAADEQLMVKVLTRSPESPTSFMCTFSCDLELALGRWPHLPGGTRRCDSFVTAAYPACDPSDVEAEIGQ